MTMDHIDDIAKHERATKRSITWFALAIVVALAVWLAFVRFL